MLLKLKPDANSKPDAHTAEAMKPIVVSNSEQQIEEDPKENTVSPSNPSSYYSQNYEPDAWWESADAFFYKGVEYFTGK